MSFTIYMVLARSDEHPSFCENAPCALFLTEGHNISTSAFQLLRIARQRGFAAFAAPWFAVRSTDEGIFVTSGIGVTANGMQAITDWIWVRPRLLAPLFPVNTVTRAALSSLADNSPRAVIAFHPQLEGESANFAKPSDLRVIPALLQAQPRLLLLYSENVPRRNRAAALLNDWWDQRMQGLSRTATFPRLLLPINLHFDESTDASGVRLIGVDSLPCGGYASEAERSSWLKRAACWLKLAHERVRDSPTLLLPKPSYCFLNCVQPLVPSNDPRSKREVHASFPAYSFSREEGRIQLRYELMAILNDGEDCTVTLKEDSAGAYEGVSLRARRVGQHVALDFTFGGETSLADVPHPLSALLPSLDSGHCYVGTSPRKDADLVFIDSKLRVPKFAADPPSAKAAILKYLGRTIDEDDDALSDSFGRRYVEPGVGRGYLVDFMRIDSRPEIRDFSVIGGGLTPYGRGGYVNVGRPIDGKVALGRALHRKLCSDRLEEAGCRIAPVVAVIELKDDHIVLTGGECQPTALVVRGFRSVLRIKQLDPVACFYHSFQARPKLVPFLTGACWSLHEDELLRRSTIREEQLFVATSDRYGVSGVLPRITSSNQSLPDPVGYDCHRSTLPIPCDPDVRAISRGPHEGARGD